MDHTYNHRITAVYPTGPDGGPPYETTTRDIQTSRPVTAYLGEHVRYLSGCADTNPGDPGYADAVTFDPNVGAYRPASTDPLWHGWTFTVTTTRIG